MDPQPAASTLPVEDPGALAVVRHALARGWLDRAGYEARHTGQPGPESVLNPRHCCQQQAPAPAGKGWDEQVLLPLPLGEGWGEGS